MGAIKSYAVLTKEPIDSLDDFKGIKVSGAGLNLRWMEGLGAMPFGLIMLLVAALITIFPGLIIY